MIHHISVAALDVPRVAKVLAELLQGYAGPFVGPIPGAYVVYSGDGHGTGIEIYPEGTVLDIDGSFGTDRHAEPGETARFSPFHALVSVPVGRDDIERIGAREGWRVKHFWRGPPGVKLFELYEFWIENRVMFELVTADMLAPYVAIANGPAQQAMLARRALT